jgi:membrane-bound lytic murein transglycosylase A
MKRIFGYSIAVLTLTLIVLLAIYSLSPRTSKALTFTKVSHLDLPDWHLEENLANGFAAFLKSCASILKKNDTTRLQGAKIGGLAKDWKPVCRAATALQSNDGADIRQFYEDNFTAYAVALAGKSNGLFTGYFEPLLRGNKEKTPQYQYPLYGPPNDLINVDLGRFRPELKGERIAGKVQKNRLVPYEDRADIDTGVLADKADVLLWVDDPVDAFFLHIQGSGRVQMPDGQLQGVGYAAQNGHVYRAIGRDLIEMGAITREDISMQSIRSWLSENRDQAQAVMQRNRSYIFFRLLDGRDGPYGSAGVALTPGHSLAVDLRHLPMHAPIWLSASYPDPKTGDDIPLSRLMVAQDTGGAIRGEIRGDVFWGFGERAAEIAGRMQNSGSYWLMLPNDLADQMVDGT